VSEPLVTIGIPMYNAAATIRATLRSCFAQTHPNVEIVLVDNNSTDGSVAAAERAAAEAGREVRVVGCREQGIGPARNAGWAIARGAYVAWVDADDLIHPDKLRWQLAALRPFEGGAAVASGDVVVEVTQPAYRGPRLLFLTALPSVDPLLEVLQGLRGLPPIGYLLTRTAADRLAETGGFLNVRRQDLEYFGKAELWGVPFVHVPRVVGLYRRWSDSQDTSLVHPLLWAPDIAETHRSWREACQRAGVGLTEAQRAALERSWGYWCWRPSYFDRRGRLVVTAPEGERALELTGVQRAVVRATRGCPVGTVESLAVATCRSMPQLFPAFGRVLKALGELIEAEAFEELDEAQARSVLGVRGA
jgi:glycosyl transferase family 2